MTRPDQVLQTATPFEFVEEDVAYLDSATISPMPREAVRVLSDFHSAYSSILNTKKFIDEQTADLLGVRRTLQNLINAAKPEEIVLTRSATEAINLVANGLEWRQDDEILLTDVEHLSNVIPWTQVAQRYGLRIRQVQTTEEGRLLPSSLRSALNAKTRLAAIGHVSNVYGGIQELGELMTILQRGGIISVIDAAQSVGRIPVDVRAIGCDFLAASGRKALMGPLGTGFLYGKLDSLSGLKPSIWGTRSAAIDDAGLIARPPPKGLEANLPCTAYLFALDAGVNMLLTLGIANVHRRVQGLTRLLLDGLQSLDHVDVFAEREVDRQAGIVSFSVRPHATQWVARLLSEKKIIMGAGNLGTGFLPSRTGCESLLRASIHYYNTERHIAKLIDQLTAFS